MEWPFVRDKSRNHVRSFVQSLQSGIHIYRYPGTEYMYRTRMDQGNTL